MKLIKYQFPIFANHSSLVYLDSAATTHKPQQVIDAVLDFYSRDNASVHRGIYASAEGATSLYEQAREKIARFINAGSSSEVIFTSGTTEGINFVASAWAERHLSAGDEMLLTQAEHHANLLPWQRVARRTGAKLRFIEIDKESFLLKDPESLLSDKTKLVSITHASNVLGHVWKPGQLESLITKAHECGALVLLDAAQSIPHQKIDVQTLNPDFLVFSGHKMCGPTGIGILYIKKELHDVVEPYQLGGSMVHSATFYDATFKDAPQKFEAGTPPVAQVVGFGEAVDFFNEQVDFASLAAHERDLCRLLYDGLHKISGIQILGNPEFLQSQGHLISFAIKGMHAHDIAALLAEKEIAVRAGHHCAQPLAESLGVESSIRVSMYLYNTKDDIQIFLQVLQEVIRELT